MRRKQSGGEHTEQPVKTVIFDFDGTLADTCRGIFRCALEALHAYGYDETDGERLRAFIGPPLFDSFLKYCNDEETARAMVAEYRKHYRAGGIFECDLYDGVLQMLAELEENGIEMAVASSKPAEFIKRILSHFEIEKYFSFVSGPVIGEREPSKAELIESALKMLGAEKSRAVMVGDRMFDIDGAKQAGVRSIGVLYGFGSEEEIISHGADAICCSVDELTELILK